MGGFRHKEERIPAYYLASNKGYHAAQEVMEEIRSAGFRTETLELPARSLALENGIGTAGKNGLLYLSGIGSRFALYTLVTDACEPILPRESNPLGCGNCTLCVTACPATAIDKAEGLTPQKCMRYHMETENHPEWVQAIMPGYLGCEICQQVCPKNAALKVAEPPEEIRKAFDLMRLASGDTADARRLVGRNITKRGKLTNEAHVFLKRDGAE